MRDNPKLRSAVLGALWRNPVFGLAVFEGSQAVLREANNVFLELLDSRFRTKKTLGMPLQQCWPELAASGVLEALQRASGAGAPWHMENIKVSRGQLGQASVSCTIVPLADEGEGGGEAAPQGVLLIVSERAAVAPSPEQMSLLDHQTRHALGQQYRLSAREIDIISECLQGKKNRQIAQDLHIGISTVKRHLESAYRKMGITSSRSLPLAILGVARGLAARTESESAAAGQRSHAA
ncbi:MAG TPA: LuxR C-terminal-related transcriptional regulator [Terriglobales bacterium]|nr:LuxR C-terminal-related transcriptional regulator [Terriglobales bacterium]